MAIKIGVVMDPIESINPKKDSTLAMLLAAQKRGWELYYFTQNRLLKRGDQALGLAQSISITDDASHWYALGDMNEMVLGDLDVILMRKDPPFDSQFLYTTFLLDTAGQQGTLIVNKPQSLRDCNEKVFATQFASCCPPVLISADAGQIRAFHHEHRDIIVKPLDGMGGASVFRIKADDGNFSVIVETLTKHGSCSIMAQRYIPEIKRGDKRILLINGVPVPYALARVPAHGETRGNLAAGGSGEARPLTERDAWICAQVGPVLKEKGILFAGIDVIGDYLTEINVTSPTCIRELDHQCGLDIGEMLMAEVESQLQGQ